MADITGCIENIHTAATDVPLVMLGGDYNANWSQGDGNLRTHKERHMEEYRTWGKNIGIHLVDLLGKGENRFIRESFFEFKCRDVLLLLRYRTGTHTVQHTYLTSHIDDWLINIDNMTHQHTY